MLAIVTNIPTPYRTAFFNILNQELLKKGDSLHVIYCAKTETGRHWKFNPDENTYPYTFLKGFHPEFKGFYPHINFGLISCLKKLKPDWVLLAGSWNAPATINVLLNKKNINIPVLFWSEGHIDAQVRSNQYVDYLRKKILRNIDYFVVPNLKSKEYIHHYNTDAIADFLPNTVDEEFFSLSESDSKAESRNRKNLPSDKTIIVLVSSLDQRKGVLEFYEAFKKSNIENLYVVQIGTGEFYETLQQKIKEDRLSDHYMLTGQLEAKEVREYLVAADVFALPTKSDPNPLSPIEAAFLKKALLISSKAGNSKELIPNNENGWIISEITQEHLTKSINTVAETSRAQLEEMGEQSFRIASASFTRKKAAENLISFLQKIKK
ncbi:glycosyltransferase family 4 protein [Chryseobacterium sp. GMJ5]|uniref:Glycosyltransferase family 4 protein n=1 Tax=Chryseobacterium gilvum TaxID=2976534 RepID=A0ABT2VYL8_9FLAO|nr:glycosyltransferase family 4 protein [Chryseobacterium gilvum]MCU7615087.1 glycosyltransferase family 4 protein [Chryseobacterium gilvum]